MKWVMWVGIIGILFGLVACKTPSPEEQLATLNSQVGNVSYVSPAGTYEGHTGEVGAVAVSSDGKLLATTSEDMTIRLWDVDTQQVIRVLSLEGTKTQSDVAFSPDGTVLASIGLSQMGGVTSHVTLWDVATGTVIRSIFNQNEYVGDHIAFSPLGNLVAFTDIRGFVVLWDITDTTSEATSYPMLWAHTDLLIAVAFSPDGSKIATASLDKTATIWDVASQQKLYTLTGHTDYVFSVQFSPDGELLATGSNDKTVRLWDVNTGEEVALLLNDRGPTPITAVAFAPDSKTLAVAQGDNAVLLWDVERHAKLRTIAVDSSPSWDIVFSPDSRYVFTASGQAATRWKVFTE